MTALEFKFLVWAIGILLGILAFVGALAVQQLMKMSSDINDIKTTLQVVSTKHEDLEKRVDRIEKIAYSKN
jgi:hypothetical protein